MKHFRILLLNLTFYPAGLLLFSFIAKVPAYFNVSAYFVELYIVKVLISTLQVFILVSIVSYWEKLKSSSLKMSFWIWRMKNKNAPYIWLIFDMILYTDIWLFVTSDENKQIVRWWHYLSYGGDDGDGDDHWKSLMMIFVMIISGNEAERVNQFDMLEKVQTQDKENCNLCAHLLVQGCIL